MSFLSARLNRGLYAVLGNKGDLGGKKERQFIILRSPCSPLNVHMQKPIKARVRERVNAYRRLIGFPLIKILILIKIRRNINKLLYVEGKP